MRYGATLEEWIRFSIELPLAVDLLPVVSNPVAVISADSKLKTLGKTPSRYNAQRQVVGIAQWTSLQANSGQIESWMREPDYGICIQTRQLRAVDIDIEDASAVERVRFEWSTTLSGSGAWDVRYRADSARVLIPFWYPEPLSKQVVTLSDGAVEILADGQQFVACGTHPKGERYQWTGFDFPTVTPLQLATFIVALGGGVSAPREARRRGASVDTADEVASWLSGRGFVRDVGRSGELFIHCPWVMDHSGDSGDTETVYYPAGSGGYAQGHFKCLHAHCAGRTDAEFLESVGFAQLVAADFDGVAESVPLSQEDAAVGDRVVAGPVAVGASGGLPVSWSGAGGPGTGLKRGRRGFVATIENLSRALSTPGWGPRWALDTFTDTIVYDEGVGGWKPVTHHLPIEVRVALEQSGFEPVGRELVRDAIELVARRHVIDSARDWLQEVSWDGVGRVAGFLKDYCGAVGDVAYLTAVGRYMWSAMAGRVLSPGCQADMVPILISESQGTGKTRGIEALAPWDDAYITLDLSHKDADLARRMRGRLVVELAEMQGMSRRDRRSLNAFITERSDSWTPKYQEQVVRLPRRNIFIGTENDDEILDDETGLRRWLPVMVSGIDREKIVCDRVQLWAEGAAIFAGLGEVAWVAVSEAAGEVRESFRVSDTWRDSIRAWIVGRRHEEPFTVYELLLGLGIDTRQTSRASEMRVAKTLKVMGFRKQRTMIDGVRKVLWGQPSWLAHIGLPNSLV